jgi:hypothetical protein
MRGLRPLVFERVESLFGNAKKVDLADLEVVGLDHGAVERFGEQLPADFFLERRVIRANEAALPGDGFDDPLAFELRVRHGDGVAIDAKLLGERADARERLPGVHGA